MNDLSVLFQAEDHVLRWKAEMENAMARYELAQTRKRIAYLISQHEPVNSLGINRERLRLVLAYIQHGDLQRLERDFEEQRVAEARGERVK